MNQYLHVVIADFQFLLDTGHVLSVLDAAEHASTDEEHRCQWRDRLLPLSGAFDGLTGMGDERGQFIVFGESEQDRDAFALRVDQVRGVVGLTDTAFRPVPPFNQSFSNLIDGACFSPIQGDDDCLLRLRDPLRHLSPQREQAA